MRRSRTLLVVASLTYFAAWLLPAIEGQAVFQWGRLPGWEATRVALSPLWPYMYRDTLVGPDSEWPWTFISVASALTNLAFVSAVIVAAFPGWKHSRGWEILLAFAAALNTVWILSDVGEWRIFRVGYYLWLGSFVLLALGLHRSRHERRAAAEQSAASPA